MNLGFLGWLLLFAALIVAAVWWESNKPQPGEPCTPPVEARVYGPGKIVECQNGLWVLKNGMVR